MQQSITQPRRGTHLLPWMTLDLGELEFRVVRVHLLDLFPGGRAEHFDDLDQLVDAGVTGEDGLPEQQLCQYAARAPDV